MEYDILGYRCACGRVHYPNRSRCACGSCSFEPVPLPKTGRLLTFTRLYTLPGDFEVGDISLGIVELENGVRMTARLEIDSPRAGMAVRGRVEVVRQDEYTRRLGMVFYPA
jgi:uncharacterized OB-fold protein